MPIEKKLADELQIKKARLQDTVMEAVYRLIPSAVLHGGTAIWRCYSGNRFSDDLDLYLKEKDIVRLRDNLTWELRRYDARINKATVVGDSTVIDIEGEGVRLKLEAGPSRGKIKPIEKNYEKTDGTFISIVSLSPEDFMYEKMNAYSSRRYVRDIYDIYHLSSIADPDRKLRKGLCSFLKNIKEPVDENVLGSIIYSGSVPSFEGMVSEISRRFC
ncbi:MAG TPA: nucleotidyl transferase AbiEii/AbiGii toxin family protein [Candidatus Saccharimonadales bacterium]|nr:nucleotidyl transferase AbiEii/AbiGii toxin family protein [Candidatus Saccharimonadales bacterium]